MSKRTTFTTITPLPRGISRQTVLSFLHDHRQIIDLNPLIKERHPIRPPSHAAPDELRCAWYSVTDHVSYLPGRVATGEVTYTCAFNNLPNGVQTHCYAPAGLDIRERWTVNGSLPGEPKQPIELGHKDVPMTGLYIREDVDMTCNIIMTSFVKKTLKDSHAALVERLKLRAQLASQRAIRTNNSTLTTSGNIAMGQNPLNNNSNLRNVNGLDRTADSRSKNLAVYDWLNAQPQGGQPQHQHQNRSVSNRSTESNGSSNNTSNLISPVSHASPSYRKMVVSPPTPPYTPMKSPLWTQLQPPPQPQTLASLSPVPPVPVSPNRPPPPRPLRPDEQNQQKKQKPTIRLIPEPLRIPRTAVPVAVVQSYSPNQVIKPPNTSPLERKNPPVSHRKFSYDSTSSTENYLVPMSLTSSSPVEVFKRLPPPQHILSQSRDYHQQAITINSPVKGKPSAPSSPVLEKLQRYMGTQFISFDPFEEHPDYPHMSPYLDDVFGEGGDKNEDNEYEDVRVNDDDDDDDGDLEIDSYSHSNERDRDILPRKTRQVQEKTNKEEKEEDIIMNDNDSGYADYIVTPPPPPPPTSKLPLPPMGIRVVEAEAEAEENQMIGATLKGPFVAAFDEFNICLP